MGEGPSLVIFCHLFLNELGIHQQKNQGWSPNVVITPSRTELGTNQSNIYERGPNLLINQLLLNESGIHRINN